MKGWFEDAILVVRLGLGFEDGESPERLVTQPLVVPFPACGGVAGPALVPDLSLICGGLIKLGLGLSTASLLA